MTNKYIHRSRISEAKFREVVRLFSLDIEASKIAKISKLNHNTVNRIFSISAASFTGSVQPIRGTSGSAITIRRALIRYIIDKHLMKFI